LAIPTDTHNRRNEKNLGSDPDPPSQYQNNGTTDRTQIQLSLLPSISLITIQIKTVIFTKTSLAAVIFSFKIISIIYEPEQRFEIPAPAPTPGGNLILAPWLSALTPPPHHCLSDKKLLFVGRTENLRLFNYGWQSACS